MMFNYEINKKHKLLKNVQMKRLALHIVLVILCITSFFPFIWMVSSSLKSNELIFSYPPQFIPDPVAWDNYSKAWIETKMGQAMLNSLLIAVIATLGNCGVSSLVAYGFAKTNFPGKNAMFIVVISTMMIPYQVVLIPLFIIFKQLGWINTYNPLIIPSLFGTASNVFLMRQYIRGIPDAYSESAFIDGCSHLRIWIQIILPMSVPMLVSLAVLTFMRHWNDYLGPMLYISSRDKMTVPLVLRMFQSNYTTQWHLLMAASCIALLPVMVLYLISQKYIISGIMLGGIKG